jgi:hypothetical protein
MILNRRAPLCALATLLLGTAGACGEKAGPQPTEKSAHSMEALSASGTESCDSLTAASYDPILSLLANARDGALANVQAHPGGDAQALLDAIDQAATKVEGGAAWLRSVDLDGTNPSAAMNTHANMTAALGLVLAASQYATNSAVANQSWQARDAFEVLSMAASLIQELGAEGGRCALDKYANDDAWWDWRKGVAPETAAPKPPPVPDDCIGASALDPLSALVSSAIGYEQAEIAAYPGEAYLEYSQVDLDIATEQRDVVASLRASLAASGLTAADAATATSIQNALVPFATKVAFGSQEAVYTATDLRGPARNAFEADVTAVDYARDLLEKVGRCTMAQSFKPIIGMKPIGIFGVDDRCVKDDVTPNLDSRDGRTLDGASIVTVFWGLNVDPQVQAAMPQFYSDVIGNQEYMGTVSQYGVHSASAGGTYFISPQTTKTSLADSDIQNELAVQANQGKLPIPSSGVAYMVHLPPGIMLTHDGGVSCAGGDKDFCAYHSFGVTADSEGFTATFAFSVVPDYTSPQCQQWCTFAPAEGALQNTTKVASHELMEILTDPRGNGWGDTNTGCEIGDICNEAVGMIGKTTDVGAWYVQDLWSNATSRCESIGTKWHDPTRLPGNDATSPIFNTAGGIAAAARVPGMLDTFAIRSDEKLWSAGVFYDGVWHDPYPVPSNQYSFVPGGGVAAAARDTHILDVFTIGYNRHLWEAASFRDDNGGHWVPSFEAEAQGGAIFKPGGGIAAVSRTPDIVEAYVIGYNRVLWNAGYWYNGWHAPFEVPHGADRFPVGGGVAALSRDTNTLETFTIGYDGLLWSAGRWDNGNWTVARPLVTPDMTPFRFIPGAQIAVTFTGGFLNAWVIGNDKKLWNAGWWYGGKWHAPYRVTTSSEIFEPGGGVAAGSFGPNSLETFAIGFDQKVWSTGYMAP